MNRSAMPLAEVEEQCAVTTTPGLDSLRQSLCEYAATSVDGYLVDLYSGYASGSGPDVSPDTLRLYSTPEIHPPDVYGSACPASGNLLH